MSELTLEFNILSRGVQFAVPTELIKKNIKNIQKQVEKSKKQCVEEIGRVQTNPHLSAADKLVCVKKIIKAAEHNRKKLDNAVQLDKEYRTRLTRRLRRLQLLREYTSKKEEVLDLHNEKLMAWFMQETNLLVADYLLKSNGSRKQNIGMKLLAGVGADPALIDHDIYTLYNDIFLAVSVDHSLEPLEAWYNENKTQLRKINSNLLFEIHYCKYLYLIEKGDIWDAIHYGKSHLAAYARAENYSQGSHDANYAANSAVLAQMGSPLLSLAAAERAGHVSPVLAYHRSKSALRWRLLHQTFTHDFATVYGITQNSPMFVYLSAGLSSLKTKSCYCNEQNTVFGTGDSRSPGFEDSRRVDDTRETNSDSRNARDAYQATSKYLLDSARFKSLSLRGPNQYYRLLSKINQCPVCSPELYALSRSLPDAQLITHIFDNPFKLPNGNIYPFDKVLNPKGDDTLVRHGKVQDPLTQEVFLIDDCVRVFPA